MGFDGGTTQYANWWAIERRKKMLTSLYY